MIQQKAIYIYIHTYTSMHMYVLFMTWPRTQFFLEFTCQLHNVGYLAKGVQILEPVKIAWCPNKRLGHLSDSAFLDMIPKFQNPRANSVRKLGHFLATMGCSLRLRTQESCNMSWNIYIEPLLREPCFTHAIQQEPCRECSLARLQKKLPTQ